MRTRFLYEGDTVVEIIRDGEDVDVVIRPSSPPEDEPYVPETDVPIDETPIGITPQPLGDPVKTVPKKGVGANVAAFIRGSWTFLIAMFVEGGSYLVSNLTSISLPPGVGLVSGAALQGAIYATKKKVFPDTVL